MVILGSGQKLEKWGQVGIKLASIFERMFVDFGIKNGGKLALKWPLFLKGC